MMSEQRRVFLTRCARAVGAFVLGGVSLGWWSERRARMDRNDEELREKRRDSVLTSLYSADPRRLLEEFHVAESRDLMRRYAIGFTSVVLAAEAMTPDHRHTLLGDVQKLADSKYGPNVADRHRVRAFPPALAAHLLPHSKDHDLDLAGDMIADAMVWPQREVQEIVCQNLVSSLTRDDHSWGELWLPDRAVNAVADYVISRRPHNPLMNTGACIALQFLTYYQLALQAREKPTLRQASLRQSESIDRVFTEINAAGDPYAWVTKSWLREFLALTKKAARARPADQAYRDLPPQASELVMGWRHFAEPSHDWFRALGLAVRNGGLLLHLNRLIASGSADDTLVQMLLQDEYGTQEAAVAIRKLEAWFANMGLSRKVFAEAMTDCPEEIGGTFRVLNEQTSSLEARPEHDPVWSLVPFREYQNPLPHVEKRPSMDWFDAFLLALTGGSLGRVLAELSDLVELFWAPSRDRTPPDVEKEVGPTAERIDEALSTPEVRAGLTSLAQYVEGDSTALWGKEDARADQEEGAGNKKPS